MQYDNAMFPEEAEISYLIFGNVEDEAARLQIYQSFFQIEIVKTMGGQLAAAIGALSLHRHAASQAAELGLDQSIHYARLESAKVKVIGLLGIVIPAGHKFLKCLLQARRCDRQYDWRKFSELNRLEDLYRRARNACEHLAERVFSGEYNELSHFSFSIHSQFRFLDPKRGELMLDFSEAALSELVAIWEMLLSMMKAAESQRNEEIASFGSPNSIPSLKRTHGGTA